MSLHLGSTNILSQSLWWLVEMKCRECFPRYLGWALRKQLLYCHYFFFPVFFFFFDSLLCSPGWIQSLNTSTSVYWVLTLKLHTIMPSYIVNTSKCQIYIYIDYHSHLQFIEKVRIYHLSSDLSYLKVYLL